MKKKILTVLGIASVAMLTLGSTLALLTSEDSDHNTMTIGNAKIEQIEQQRTENGSYEEYQQDKKLLPTTATELEVGENGFYTTAVTNAQDKIVTVKNTGSESVYVRTVIAVEAPNGYENAIAINKNSEGISWTTVKGIATINGVNYKILVATYNAALESNATTVESLKQVVMTRESTNETLASFGEKVDILVLSQAVQTAGYKDGAQAALNDAFGKITNESHPWNQIVYVETEEELISSVKNSKKVILGDNIEITKNLIVDKEITIDLNGKSIVMNVSADINEPVIYNKGNLTIENGTISNKNATAGNTNVAAVYNESGKLTIKNSTIENIAPTSKGAYALTVKGGNVTLENTVVKGNRGGIEVSGNGSVTMNGGSVSANVYYTLYTSGTGNSTFNGVTFTKQNNSKGKAITFNNFNPGEGTITFTDCTFESETTSEISFDISSKTTGFTFDGTNEFKNVTNPNN